MTERYLYILVEHGGEFCKIGISVDPWTRSSVLPETFDYEASLMVAMPFDSAVIVERFIHKALKHLSVPKERGDGHTEWFSIKAKEAAMSIVDSYGPSLSIRGWEKMDLAKSHERRVVRKTLLVGKHSFHLRLTPAQEDRVMIHAARHKIKKLSTMVQVLFEEGLALMDRTVKEEGAQK